MNNNLKRMISFKKLNLMQAEYPFHGSFDFIFCRNVMIYFDRPTQEKLVNKFYSYLEPGGYLFIGHSESLTGLDHGFSYIKPTIYKK
jgi:chemotaxis protein methyltransferase CheR